MGLHHCQPRFDWACLRRQHGQNFVTRGTVVIGWELSMKFIIAFLVSGGLIVLVKGGQLAYNRVAPYSPSQIVMVACILAIVIGLITFLLAMRAQLKRRLSQISTTKSEVAAINFINRLQGESVLVAALFGALASWSWFVSDRNSIAIALLAMLLVVLRSAAIAYRIRQGYHGSTAAEVNELIDFINDHIASHGRPPGKRGLARSEDVLGEISIEIEKEIFARGAVHGRV